MQKSKKTEPITFRTSKEIKEILQIMAEERDWTISQLVERKIREIAISEKKSWNNEPDINEDEFLTEEEILQREYDKEKREEKEQEKDLKKDLNGQL